MSLGGRPKEEGGHTRVRISLNKLVKEALEKLPKGSRSRFIEEVLTPVVEQWDPAGSPGPACEVLTWIDNVIHDKIHQEIVLASKVGDYKRAGALSDYARALAEASKPYRVLCGVPGLPLKPLDRNEMIERSPELRELKDQFLESLERIRELTGADIKP